MKNIIKLIVGIVIFFDVTHAKVWESKNQWDSEWQNSYQSWVSSSVEDDIFTNPKSPLYGVSTDCADALYTVRVYFAYKNSLPIKLNRPNGTSLGEKIISNDSDLFDKIIDEKKKLKKFIDYVNAESGTETLAYYDSFPVKISSLSSGDVFVTKWRFLTKTAKHSYILKNIDRTNGDQILLWSDEPSKIRQLKTRIGSPQFTAKGQPWGYRRWKFPSDYNLHESKISPELGYSREQYVLQQNHSGRKVFKIIKKMLTK